MSDWGGIVWLVVLLAANGFFVAAEFAVISAKRSQIEPAAESGKRGARTTLWAMEHATLMLATTQLGITVCSLLILNVSEPAIHHLVAVPLNLTGLSADAIGTIAFIIALVVVSFLHVVLGEMVPKNVSFSVPDRAALILAPPLVGIARVLKPIITALNASANGVVRLFGVQPASEAASTFTLDEVETIVSASTREGSLTDTSGALTAAFEFSSKKANSLALPVDDLVCLREGVTGADVERAVARNGFSRYVIVDSSGEPTGYIHVKDVLDQDPSAPDDTVHEPVDASHPQPVPAERIRQLISISAGTDIEDALPMMRESGVHLARVFDAQGATAPGPAVPGATVGGATVGVLFLEDIIEELVGEVQDATQRADSKRG